MQWIAVTTTLEINAKLRVTVIAVEVLTKLYCNGLLYCYRILQIDYVTLTQ